MMNVVGSPGLSAAFVLRRASQAFPPLSVHGDRDEIYSAGTPSCAGCLSPVSLLTSTDQWCELVNGTVSCFVCRSGTA